VKQSVNHSALRPGSCYLLPNITPSRLKATITLRAYHLLKRSLIWLVLMTETGIYQSHGTPRPRPRPRMRPRGRRTPHPHLPRKRAHAVLGYAPGYGLRVHELSTVLLVLLPTSRSPLAYLVPDYLSLTCILLIHTRSVSPGMPFHRM